MAAMCLAVVVAVVVVAPVARRAPTTGPVAAAFAPVQADLRRIGLAQPCRGDPVALGVLLRV